MIKKLLASVREYKVPSLLTPVTVALEVVMEVIIPLLMAKLIDEGIGTNGNGSTKTLLLMGLAILGCSVLSLLFGVLGGKFSAEAMAGFSKNLRHDMFHRVQTFSFANIDKFSASSIITRLTTDVMNVQNSYAMILRVAIRGPLMLIFGLVMAFTINVKLSLIFVATVPVLFGGLLLISSRVHPLFRKMFRKMDDLNRVVQENLHGIRVVKSFVREDYEYGKFKPESQNVYA
ncbi:MAG: ABC transporter ATP-binding protein, partial [Lachnospiraceae bacterium]|nr:ABC transporter ATP-binding protein [Lachnospiraceae bacterium]